jgi:hypothetical protein
MFFDFSLSLTRIPLLPGSSVLLTFCPWFTICTFNLLGDLHYLRFLSVLTRLISLFTFFLDLVTSFSVFFDDSIFCFTACLGFVFSFSEDFVSLPFMLIPAFLTSCCSLDYILTQTAFMTLISSLAILLPPAYARS